jgi:hypothetical protein
MTSKKIIKKEDVDGCEVDERGTTAPSGKASIHGTISF